MTNLIEKFTDSVPSWGAKLSYGEKVTLDGHDILPVAMVVFGFGAGEGSGEQPASDTRRPEGVRAAAGVAAATRYRSAHTSAAPTASDFTSTRSR